MDSIIISTTMAPTEWTKDIVGIVNGFSVIGTGPIAELCFTLTDILEKNLKHIMVSLPMLKITPY